MFLLLLLSTLELWDAYSDMKYAFTLCIQILPNFTERT